jgi:hypothetical protein
VSTPLAAADIKAHIPAELEGKAEVIALHSHLKASEHYVEVKLKYSGGLWHGFLPIEYRRTGIELRTVEEIAGYIAEAYELLDPALRTAWLAEQEAFWSAKEADITKAIFDALTSFKWTCVSHGIPSNPNWARRNQDLKELGYTISTARVPCTECGKTTTHVMLLALPRGGTSGYESMSPSLRKRVIKVLNNYDAFEGRRIRADSLLPDHKFPEIRWDTETRRESLETLTDDEIKRDFQLLNNQRNLQKREACRSCYQTGKRSFPLGIPFFYAGNGSWPGDVPEKGKAAERGCFGCGWYDLEAWREAANRKLAN